ncbi:MAG: H-NS histone family protein [Halochromatium sp.]|nr:H-NS histone family protein [Halochromatium sp.]
MENRSAEEIQAQLEQLRQSQAALERVLEERQQEEKKDFIGEIKQLITDRGHHPEDIAELLSGGKRKRRSSRTGKSNADYTPYVDPDNPENVYTRGRMPNWLIKKMAANGFDPTNAEHRAQFKDQHLVQRAA